MLRDHTMIEVFVVVGCRLSVVRKIKIEIRSLSKLAAGDEEQGAVFMFIVSTVSVLCCSKIVLFAVLILDIKWAMKSDYSIKIKSIFFILMATSFNSLTALPMFEVKKSSDTTGYQKGRDACTLTAGPNQRLDEERGEIDQGIKQIKDQEGTEEVIVSYSNLPIVMPLGFSKNDRTSLMKDLKQMNKKLGKQPYSRDPVLLDILSDLKDKWSSKGVVYDTQFVAEAKNLYEKTKLLDDKRSVLVEQAEESLEKLEKNKSYYFAIRACDDVVKHIQEVVQAWHNTSDMYERIAGPRLGSRLKTIRAREAQQWEEERKTLLDEFLHHNAKEAALNAGAIINKMRARYKDFDPRNQIDQLSELSNACEKVIISKQALASSQQEVERLVSLKVFSETDLDSILTFELALDAVETLADQAEDIFKSLIGEQEEDENEIRTTNESMSTFEKLGRELSLEKSNKPHEKEVLFQQRAELLKEYAQKTLNIGNDISSIFNSGGEFADPADKNDLLNAWNKINEAMIVLNVFQKKRDMGPDSLLLKKNQLTIANLEKAVEQFQTIANRLADRTKYQAGWSDDLLEELKAIKGEYEERRANSEGLDFK